MELHCVSELCKAFELYKLLLGLGGQCWSVVFVATESEMVLVERLVDRKAEIMESLLVRIGTAREEMKHVKNFDYVVVNAKGKLDNAVKLMESIIDARKLGFVRGLLSYNGQSTW